MSKMPKVAYFLIFLAMVSGGYYALAAVTTTYTAGTSANGQATATFTVTAADLVKAGFNNVKQKTETASGQFKAPPYYFEVSDRVSAALSEAPNIVEVSFYQSPYVFAPDTAFYTYGADSHPFAITGGTGKEGTMPDNRIAVSFAKGSTYVVVMGPNKQKIETLVLEIANRIK